MPNYELPDWNMDSQQLKRLPELADLWRHEVINHDCQVHQHPHLLPLGLLLLRSLNKKIRPCQLPHKHAEQQFAHPICGDSDYKGFRILVPGIKGPLFCPQFVDVVLWADSHVYFVGLHGAVAS
ncbi:hypothetical protein Nepgr_007319 [Nepenthes gracilis]|uniref:Uncharacterized protein n=1 Tax=Nepenthes gracilis TaxID=150966 RepID=A0AAD3S6W6_NEPGR|nr:hypothetical protein Nepgr_007319 [Nepenthes gracilis]